MISAITIVAISLALVAAGGEEQCCKPDLVAMLDRSSVSDVQFNSMVRPVLNGLINHLENCDQLRLAMLEYGTSVHVKSTFHDLRTISSIRSHLNDFKTGEILGHTETPILGDALEGLPYSVFDQRKGKRPDSPSFVVIFMGKDSKSPFSAMAKADRLKKTGVTVIVFAIGDDHTVGTTKAIASRPDLYIRLSEQSVRQAVKVLSDVVCPKANKINREMHENGDGKPRRKLTSAVANANAHVVARTPEEMCSYRRSRSEESYLPVDNDCHSYLECKFPNATHVSAEIKRCGDKEIFHAESGLCVPEGPSECSDYCRHNHVAGNGCYGVKSNCAAYFICAHGVSYGKCCMYGYSFNIDSCGCVPSEHVCEDDCKMNSGQGGEDSEEVEDQYAEHKSCRDPYGNVLRTHPGRPDLYDILDNSQIKRNRMAFITLPCASGSLFDVDTCTCQFLADYDTPVVQHKPAPYVKGRQCQLYLPFDDDDVHDKSINKFSVYKRGQVSLNRHGDTARGDKGRSLLVNGGYLDVPGLSGSDIGNQGSWCLFYRCQQHDDSYECTKSGGLMSNNKDAYGDHFSFILSSQYKNKFSANLRFSQPDSMLKMDSAINPSFGWNHVCVVYDGANAELYINGVCENKRI